MIGAHLNQISAKAQDWLVGLKVPGNDLPRQMQQFFGIWVAGMRYQGRPDLRTKRILQELAPRIQSFNLLNIDPFLLLVVANALKASDCAHESIHNGILQLKSVFESSTARPLDMLLVRCLVSHYVEGTCDVGQLPRKTLVTSSTEVVRADRDRVREFCRTVMSMTACGKVQVTQRDTLAWLSPLALSYAIDGDIPVVNSIIRSCIYCGISDSESCRWAFAWLLEQQQSDGRFGAVAPENSKNAPADWRLSFMPTIETLWTIRELQDPGFMLR